MSRQQGNSIGRIDLHEIWAAVQLNPGAARALRTLENHGFALKQIGVAPNTWTGIIARFPYLPSNSAASRSIAVPKSVDEATRFLRKIADALGSEYSEVEARNEKGVIYTNVGVISGFPNFRALSNDLEKISRSRWVVTEHNPQNNAIATLRWEIKHRTGEAHDAELICLLRAACKAAKRKFPLNSTLPLALDAVRKSVDHERATRKAGRRKLLRPEV